MTAHYEIVSHRQARDFRGCGWTWTVGAFIGRRNPENVINYIQAQGVDA